MRTIVFYGCGGNASKMIRIIQNNPDIFEGENFLFTDGNSKLWGKPCFGYEVVSPQELLDMNFDFAVITSDIYMKEIKNNLLMIGINENKIVSLNEYKQDMFVKGAFKKRYLENQSKHSFKNSKNIVVYTAIMGDFDVLKTPKYQGQDVKYVCYTNNKNIQSDIWEIRYVESDETNNRRLAKHYKLNPHLLFPEYDTSVWVDGKFEILDNLNVYINMYRKKTPILFFPHFERNCIYREAAECISAYIADADRIVNQIADYYNQGFPFNQGLYEGGCIVRQHNDSQVINMMKEWSDQIQKYSIRDQISLPYVFWKNEFTPDVSDLNINDNRWLKYYPHNSV